MESPALESAKVILLENGLSMADLPKDASSSLWDEYKAALGLTMPQLLALKNAIISGSIFIVGHSLI